MLNHAEIRAAARRRLPRGIFEYIDRGTEDEVSLSEAIRAWQRIKLVPDTLVDVSVRDLSTELFGRRVASPIVIAPTSLAGLVWYDGEVVLARAAAAAGIPVCISTQSSAPIERIATAGGWIWQQLYVWRNRELTWKFLDRVRAAGADVLVLTVDTAVSPKREYNIHNGFGIPIKPSFAAARDIALRPRWLIAVLLRTLITDGIPTYAHYPAEFRTRIGREAIGEDMRLDERVNWDFVKELRRRWKGPLVIKGLLGVEDARRAVEHGCDGIVVSSHGARNLDSAVSSADALAPIADAVGERITVMVDSGIRRGSDIVKARALGARAVLVGRLPLFAISVGGEAGAKAAIDILSDEMSRTMAFLGRTKNGQIGRDLIAGASRTMTGDAPVA